MSKKTTQRSYRLASHECEGKKAYKTYRQAEIALRWMLRERGAQKGERRRGIYRCPHCQPTAYHIGHILPENQGRVPNAREETDL